MKESMELSTVNFSVNTHIRKLDQLDEYADNYNYSHNNANTDPIGLLYGARVDDTTGSILIDAALAEYGTHKDDLLPAVYREKLITEQEQDPNGLGFHNIYSQDGQKYSYLMFGWQASVRSPNRFPINGLCLAKEQASSPPEMDIYAEISTRALMLALLNQDELNDGDSIIWTPEQLRTVPVENIKKS